jgi:hypothetical protein
MKKYLTLKLFRMKKSLLLLSWAAITSGFMACSDDEPTPIPLVNIQEINSLYSVQMFSYNGVETEASGVTFKFLNGTPISTDMIYEADMEMKLPISIRTSTAEKIVYNPMTFHVHAVSYEDRITFSGDPIQGAGDLKYNVEGIYKKASPKDTLYINLKCESPQAAFAGKTYELLLTEDAIDLKDFEDNKLAFEGDRPVLEQAEEAIPIYMEYLKDRTNTTGYLFNFQTDGTLAIQKYNTSTNSYEALPGTFKYYIADNELGFIEMELEYSAKLLKLLTGSVSQNAYYAYTCYETYLLKDIITMTFCYKLQPEGLSLAIGDKSGFSNMRDMLLEWQDWAGKDYSNGTELFSSLYMSWNKRENYSDQLWWRLEEK